MQKISQFEQEKNVKNKLLHDTTENRYNDLLDMFPRERQQVKYFFNPKRFSYLIHYLTRERGLIRTPKPYTENSIGTYTYF